MIDQLTRPSPRPVDRSLRAAAFDLSPWPAWIVEPAGVIAAVNEAAEALLGQSLGPLTRGRLMEALPATSPIRALLRRAQDEDAPVREHAVDVVLPNQPPFSADAAAVPLGDGSILLTINPRSSLERGTDANSSPALAGLGRMLAHEIKNRCKASAARRNC